MFIETDRGIQITTANATKFFEKLEAGVYSYRLEQGWTTTHYLDRINAYDVDYNVNCGVFKQAKDAVDQFVSPEMSEVRELMSIPNRIGMLFYGVPGTGKTYLAGQIAFALSKTHDAIGIIVKGTEGDPSWMIDAIRKNDPNRLIVLIFDEFDKSSGKGTTQMLSFLDGADSKDNTIVIGTLNRFYDLPSTVIARPSRFEKILAFSIEDDNILNVVMKSLVPESLKDSLNYDNIRKVVKAENDRLIKEWEKSCKKHDWWSDEHSKPEVTIDYIKVAVKNEVYNYVSKKHKVKANKSLN